MKKNLLLAALLSSSLLFGCSTENNQSGSGGSGESGEGGETNVNTIDSIFAGIDKNFTLTTAFPHLANLGGTPMITSNFTEDEAFINYNGFADVHDFGYKNFADGNEFGVPVGAYRYLAKNKITMTLGRQDSETHKSELTIKADYEEEILIEIEDDSIVSSEYDSTKEAFVLTPILAGETKLTLSQTVEGVKLSGGRYNITVGEDLKLSAKADSEFKAESAVVGSKIDDSDFRNQYITPGKIKENAATLKAAFKPSLGEDQASYGTFNLNFDGGDEATLTDFAKYMGIYKVVSATPDLTLKRASIYFGPKGSDLSATFYAQYKTGYDSLKITASITSVGTTSISNW